jgi:hypothetical protein
MMVMRVRYERGLRRLEAFANRHIARCEHNGRLRGFKRWLKYGAACASVCHVTLSEVLTDIHPLPPLMPSPRRLDPQVHQGAEAISTARAAEAPTCSCDGGTTASWVTVLVYRVSDVSPCVGRLTVCRALTDPMAVSHARESCERAPHSAAVEARLHVRLLPAARV